MVNADKSVEEIVGEGALISGVLTLSALRARLSGLARCSASPWLCIRDRSSIA